MDLSLRVLRYVVETADCGSVTEAAKRLQVSQPSISTALAQVEAQIGVQIFVRHHARGVTLSAAGQRFINEARLLLNHARGHCKLNVLRPKISPCAFAYAVCRRAISFHICMAAARSSR
ncbi:MAG: LysR family transcriptional regulator [Martelella sp.]|uniref:LysR family transcriptional regulator n=1 Tax=Martelella sp. TaxID=1969699 RepID=UPI003242BFFD